MKNGKLLLLVSLVAASAAIAEADDRRSLDGIEYVSKLHTADGVKLPQDGFRAATFSVW